MPFFLGFLFLAVKGFLTQKYGQQVSVPQLPALLHYRFTFGLSVMDLSLISATLIYSAILLWTRQKRSLTRGARKLTFLYVDSKEPIDPLSWGAAEVMAKTLGNAYLGLPETHCHFYMPSIDLTLASSCLLLQVF